MKDLVDKFTWLSSDHINAYFTILNSEYGECVYAFSTYFYAKLMKGIEWTANNKFYKKTPQLDDHSCGVFAKLLSAGLNDDKVIKEAFD
nr:8041_t:CDS:2 [Entrophospora candida]